MVWPMSPRPSSLVRAAAAGLGLLLAAAPTAAQTPKAPPDFHARVFVAGFDRPLEVRQSGLRRRTDLATGGVVQSIISDRTRGALVVMTAAGRRRIALLFPLATAEVNAPVPLELSQMSGAQFTRMGAANVAGRPCQLHRYSRYLGRSGVLCASAEGLVLQLKPDGRTSPLFEVLSITYARQEQRWFVPPPDYQLSALPGVGGIAARPGGR